MLFSELSVIKVGIEKSIRDRKLLDLLLLLLLIVQICVCAFFNFFCMKGHLGFDANWSILKTILIWNEKTIFSNQWFEQNNLNLDTATFFSVPLYGITHNVFLSFAIVNTIVLWLILICMGSILSEINIKHSTKLIVLNLIVCPFLSNGFSVYNDLMYFSNIIVGAAHNAIRALTAVLIVYNFIKIRKTNLFSFLSYITFALCLLSGLGTGVYMLILILIPYLVFELIMFFIKNDIKCLKNKESLFAYISIICVFIGRYFASVIVSKNAIDVDRTWTSIENIWVNVVALFQGMLGILEVLPLQDSERVSILSFDGIKYVFPIIIFALLIVAFFHCVYKIKANYREQNEVVLFLVNIIVINCVTFCMFNVKYGSLFFEDRYLITTFFISLILLAIYIDDLNPKLYISTFIIISLTISIAFNDLLSDLCYAFTNNPMLQVSEEIDHYLDSQNDSELVYVWGISDDTLEFTLRLIDLDRCYILLFDEDTFFHSGDYTYYDNNGYNGTTYIIVNNQSTDVPAIVDEGCELVNVVDGYGIYRCEYNPFRCTDYVTYNRV